MTEDMHRHHTDFSTEENLEHIFEKLREIVASERRNHQWVIPIVLFLVAQFGAGIWWAADISARLVAIEEKVEVGTYDRYFGKDAIKDFSIRDDRMDFLQDQVNELKSTLREHRRETNEFRKELNKGR